MSQPQEAEICSYQHCSNPLPPKPVSGSESGPQEWRRCYRKLNEDVKEIRLLRIKPDQPEHRVECELLYTPLFESPTSQEWKETTAKAKSGANGTGSKFLWRALSHIWGPPADNKTGGEAVTRFLGTQRTSNIFIDGDKVTLSSRLFECLFFLRHLNYLDPIWIDVLCINQTDNAERGAQVQMMSDIYAAAEEVLLYIPWNPTNKHNLATVGQELYATGILMDDDALARAILDFGLITEEDSVLEVVADIFRERGKDTYWKRMWTIQECVYARTLTLISGTAKVSWKRLCQIDEMVDRLAQLMANDEEKMKRFHDHAEVKLKSLALINRERLRSTRGTARLLKILSTNIGICSCTDPRDFIYALVGLVNPTQGHCSGTKIEYTLCEWCVWPDATIRIIQDDERLDVLAGCGFLWDSDPPDDTKVSWVTNWNIFCTRTTQDEQYQFSPGTKADWHFSPDWKQLHASGFVLGSLATPPKYVTYDPSLIDRSLSLAHRVHSQIDSFLCDNTSDYSHREKCWEDLETLHNEWFLFSEMQFAAAKKICRPLTSSPVAGADDRSKLMDDVRKNFASIFKMQQLVMVARDPDCATLGVGVSPHMEKGDVVCGILGCRVPLVVRRREDGDRIMGPCWIGGYGRGQAVEELRAGKRTLETFRFV